MSLNKTSDSYIKTLKFLRLLMVWIKIDGESHKHLEENFYQKKIRAMRIGNESVNLLPKRNFCVDFLKGSQKEIRN